MKSILHLKDDTEYQIPLREKDNRAEVGTTAANPEAAGMSLQTTVISAFFAM